MKKIKALPPSLREKKRYAVFEILSNNKIKAFSNVSKAIQHSYKDLFGTVGLGKAGLIILAEKYDGKNQKGIIRVNNKNLDNLRSAFTLIQEIEGQEVVVQSIGVSGILKKAVIKYLAG